MGLRCTLSGKTLDGCFLSAQTVDPVAVRPFPIGRTRLLSDVTSVRIAVVAVAVDPAANTGRPICSSRTAGRPEDGAIGMVPVVRRSRPGLAVFALDSGVALSQRRQIVVDSRCARLLCCRTQLPRPASTRRLRTNKVDGGLATLLDPHVVAVLVGQPVIVMATDPAMGRPHLAALFLDQAGGERGTVTIAADLNGRPVGIRPPSAAVGAMAVAAITERRPFICIANGQKSVDQQLPKTFVFWDVVTTPRPAVIVVASAAPSRNSP